MWDAYSQTDSRWRLGLAGVGGVCELFGDENRSVVLMGTFMSLLLQPGPPPLMVHITNSHSFDPAHPSLTEIKSEHRPPL